jgi:hypothetical protein
MTPSTTSKFSINSKNFSLTYPQCELTIEYALSKLLSLAPIYACISREHHGDGGLHLHGLLCFGQRKSVRSHTYFDIDGHHCNIQSARDATAWYTYIRKDGNYQEWGLFPNNKSSWASLILLERREDFLNEIQNIAPRDYILQHDRILSYADKRYGDNNTNYEASFGEWKLPDELTEWLVNIEVRKD